MKKQFLIIILLMAGYVSGAGPKFNMLRSSQITGLIPDINDVYGVAFRDLNNDNRPDMYLVCFRNLNRLLINNGGIIPFVDRTIRSGTGGNLMSAGNSNLELGVSVADYDNDGLPDLFLAGWGKSHRLFRNAGGVRFENVTARLHAQGVLDANQGLWLEANGDGFADLYITDEHHANRLLINRKDGSFAEQPWTESFIDQAVSQGAAAGDLNGDGFTDLYVCNWFEPDYLLLNDGTGRFQRSEINIATLRDSVSTNSATLADFDNDGDLDVMVAGDNGRVYWFENTSHEGVLELREKQRFPFMSVGDRVFGVVAADFDLNGWLDVFITTRGTNRLYLNEKGRFNTLYDTDALRRYSTGAAVADLDSDGDLDLLVANKDDNSQVYLNPLNESRSVMIHLEGVRSNRDALGARVWLYDRADSAATLLGYREVSAGNGYLSCGTDWLCFGMGGRDSAYATMEFPGGRRIAKQLVWRGERYRFVENGWPVRISVTATRVIRNAFHHPDFEINLALLTGWALWLALYLLVGLKRYGWSSGTMGWQLFIWLIAMYALFILFRGETLYRLLSVLFSVTLSGSLLALLLFENGLRQRRRHTRFRERIHALGERLLQIHHAGEMLENIEKAINAHPDVLTARFVKTERRHGLCHVRDPEKSVQPFVVTREGEPIKRHEKKSSVVEMLLPVLNNTDEENALYIKMRHFKNHLNRDDLKVVQSLLAQLNIALDNLRYVKETADLVEELTRSRVREEYVEQLRNTNKQLDQKNKELRRLFRELQEKESQLIHSEKMASLGHLVAGISHELNNPISFIYANMKILNTYLDDLQKELETVDEDELRKRMEEQITELRSIIEDSARGSLAVKQIVKDLKSFSRLDQAEYKSIRPSELVDTCLKMMKTQIGDRVEVLRQIEFDEPVLCNPGQLNQVIINLMTNAVQAMQYEGTLIVHTEKSEDAWSLSVADSGPGIPAEVLPNIFDPFFTTKDVDQGTGLGLSVSHTIIEKHGGKITAENRAGGGAVFRIILPLGDKLKHG